jgi:hypothetical protein
MEGQVQLKAKTPDDFSTQAKIIDIAKQFSYTLQDGLPGRFGFR